MVKAFSTREGWSDRDNPPQYPHQNQSKNNDNNDASEKTEQFDSSLIENDDNSDNAMRDDFLSTHTSTCTVQFNKNTCEEARKKKETQATEEERFGRLWDVFTKKCELEYRYGHDDADGARTRSSPTSSSSTSSTGTGNDVNNAHCEKLGEFFRKGFEMGELLSKQRKIDEEANQNNEADAVRQQLTEAGRWLFEEARKQQEEKMERERKRERELEEDKLEKMAWKLFGLYDSDDDTDEELDEKIEMLKQQYEDPESYDFSCSSSESATDEEDLYRITDSDEEDDFEDFKEFLKICEKEGNKPCYWWVKDQQQKRAAAEMLHIAPSQCIGPVVQQKHIIERTNKFFDVNQQRYVEYKTETKKKEPENDTERNDTSNHDDDSNNGAEMTSTAIDEQERMRILRDIKAMIKRNKDEPETRTKNVLNTTNDTAPISDESFDTNKSINDTETEASEIRIFPEEFHPPPELIPSQNLEEEQERTNESDTSKKTTNEEERNKTATEKVTEKKNGTTVATEREPTIENTEEEQEEEQEGTEESDMQFELHRFQWDLYNLELDLEDATEKWEFEALLELNEQKFDDKKRQLKFILDCEETKSDMEIDPNDIIYDQMHDLQEELTQIMQIIKQIASKYTEFLRGEDKVIYNGHKETEDDGCDETRRRHDEVQQGNGCEESEGRNRETVDTGETNPSTGSKRSDHQHQQESADTEKGPTLMIERTANEGINRINMEINQMIRQKKQILYVRPTIYEVKRATCKRKKKCKCKYMQMKQKQTVIRNGIHMDTADGHVIDTTGTKNFTMVRIKDRFPDEWNGRSPIYNTITKRITFKARRIDDRFPDEWNGRSPIGHN